MAVVQTLAASPSLHSNHHDTAMTTQDSKEDISIEILPVTEFDLHHGPCQGLPSEPWKTLLNIAVDAALVENGDVIRFSERCLFFAQILLNKTAPPKIPTKSQSGIIFFCIGMWQLILSLSGF